MFYLTMNGKFMTIEQSWQSIFFFFYQNQMYNSTGMICDKRIVSFRLKSSGIPVKFCTNETQCTREKLISKLNKLGFSLTSNEVHSPAPLAVAYIKEHKLRPYLLIHKEALGDYEEVEKTEPNCVVVGDAAEEFNYENMNKAFRVLLQSNNPILLALGTG